MLTWTITRNDVTSVDVEMCGTRATRARIFPRATSECAGSMPGRAPARTTARRSDIEGAAPDATRCAPGEPSLVPIQVSEIPFPGPASPPDASWTKPAKNSPTSQCLRTTVVLDAFGVVIRTSRRHARPRRGESGSCPASGRNAIRNLCHFDKALKPVGARAREWPGKETGKPPGGPQSRIARRQLQLPRARAFGRQRNCLGHGCPRLSCHRGNDL